MKAFRAIVALTFRNAVRSHIFQLLLVLLLLCVTLIPFSISTGKIDDLIRVSLLYSLWSVSIVLTLSSLWLGCYVMSHDIDSYQIHMVVSKPIPRWSIWLGKWVGINLINVVLLLLAGLVVYGIVMLRYSEAGEAERFADREVARQNAEAERARIRSQILVGRRVFMPELPDPERVAEAAINQRLQELAQEGRQFSDTEIAALRDEVRRDISTRPIEVLPAQLNEAGMPQTTATAYTWTFRDLPTDLNEAQLILRFRPYLDKIASEDQRESRMWWAVLDPARVESAGESGSFVAVTPNPGSYFTGEFHEHYLPSGVIAPDGTVKIQVLNTDTQGGKHYFQISDGPQLLIPVCSFEENYLRAMLVMTIQLLLLSGLACAFGGCLTMPTAIFMVVSYLLFGSLSMILTDTSFFISTAWDKIGNILARCLLTVVIPLQNFDVTDMLSGGELIEFSFIGKLFFEYFLLRGVPLFLLGIWLYRRREMGSAVRK